MSDCVPQTCNLAQLQLQAYGNSRDGLWGLMLYYRTKRHVLLGILEVWSHSSWTLRASEHSVPLL